MLERFSLWSRYQFERFLMRGPLSRLLLVLGLIAWIAFLGGFLAYLFSDAFPSLAEAVWWSFLRLTDPGYLGDDHGVFLRTLSTIITVIGYVVFLGALVAIMTQWFHQTMGNLSAGVTRMVRKNHIVVIGFTNRTATILRELFLSSGRVRHFLRLRGTRQLHVAILSERAPAEVMSELQSELGEVFSRSAVTIRYGSPLRLDHLMRVDFLRASAILVPADDERGLGWTTRDEDTTKVLLAIGQAVRNETSGHRPVLVAEVSSDEKAELARRAYAADSEIVPTEQMVAWMIAQEVKCPGSLGIFDELLAQEEGHRVYVSPADRFVGRTIEELAVLLPEIVVLGVIRGGAAPILNPPAKFSIEPRDRLVALATDLSLVSVVEESAVLPVMPELELREVRLEDQARRVLLLGWSRKVPALIDALGDGPVAAAKIDIFARVPIAEREILIHRSCPDHRALSVHHFEGDTTSVRDLSRLDFTSYDHVILIASDRLESDAESDARTILTSFAVDEILQDVNGPLVTVEILHPESGQLLQQRQLSVVQSTAIPSLLLTQICVSRELHQVFDDIIRPRGAEIRLLTAEQLRIPAGKLSFAELFLLAKASQMTLLGACGEGKVFELAPGRDAVLEVRRDTRLIVLLTDNR